MNGYDPRDSQLIEAVRVLRMFPITKVQLARDNFSRVPKKYGSFQDSEVGIGYSR